MGRQNKELKNKTLANSLKRLARNLKKYRLEKELTQRELADKAGINITTIIEIENNQCSDVKLSTVCNICNALKLEGVGVLMEE